MSDVMPVTGKKSSDERKELLARAIQNQLSLGKRRVETRGDYDAVIVKRKAMDISTGGHIALSVVTLGLWVFVWIILAIVDKEKRYMLNIDDYGNTTISELE